jgi:hypothetical protein
MRIPCGAERSLEPLQEHFGHDTSFKLGFTDTLVWEWWPCNRTLMKTDGLITRVKGGISGLSCPETGRCPGHHIEGTSKRSIWEKGKLMKE